MTASTLSRIKRSLRECQPGLSLRLCLFEEQYCFDFFGYLVALPILDRYHREPYEIMESWGVYYDNASVVFCRGNKTKFVHMPWDWDHVNSKYMVVNTRGEWEPCRHSWEKDGPDDRLIQEFPYTYTLKNGEVQNVIAKIHVERREWRRKCFWRIPWFAKRRQSIDVSFNKEVGERSGSWKGGCIGCGYDMKKGETPEQTLRRMEKERKFT